MPGLVPALEGTVVALPPSEVESLVRIVFSLQHRKAYQSFTFRDNNNNIGTRWKCIFTNNNIFFRSPRFILIFVATVVKIFLTSPIQKKNYFKNLSEAAVKRNQYRRKISLSLPFVNLQKVSPFSKDAMTCIKYTSIRIDN